MAKAKFDIKTVQTEAQKSAQRAFHAGVGVTDLAVEVVRDYTAGAQKRIVSLQKSVSTIEPKALRTQALLVQVRNGSKADTVTNTSAKGQELPCALHPQPAS